MNQHSPAFVGIDVAKDRLDVHVLPSGETFAVPRDHAGLERLVAHLRQATPALVGLEATGVFEITVRRVPWTKTRWWRIAMAAMRVGSRTEPAGAICVSSPDHRDRLVECAAPGSGDATASPSARTRG